MSFLRGVGAAFARPRRLKGVSIDELRKAQATLEHEQDRLVREIEEIEERRCTLDAEGRAESQVRKQRMLARRLLRLETQAEYHRRNLVFIFQLLRIVDGLIFLKERERVVALTPLKDILHGMNGVALRDYVDQATRASSLKKARHKELTNVSE